MSTANRAMCFVDGSNFYHGLKNVGVHNLGQLSFAKIAKKVCGPRDFVGLRYYVGKVRQTDNKDLYASQRSFIDRQQRLDPRISFHFGRMEERPVVNDVARELREYLVKRGDLDGATRTDLSNILVRNNSTLRAHVEKAVDVMLAVDLVILAEQNQYDTAYIFSADGDYTHAVDFVRSRNKRVYAVSASSGAQLASRVDSFIRVPAEWVNDCYI